MSTKNFLKIWSHPKYREKLTKAITNGPISLFPHLHSDFLKKMEQLFLRNYDDLEFAQALNQTYHNELLQPGELKRSFEEAKTWRANNRVGSILKLIPENHSISRILDYGCHDGVILEALMQELGLQKQFVYGCDLDNWTHDPKFTHIHPKELENPHFRNSFDLIMLLMVLHHLKKPDEFIENLALLSKPGAIAVVREHSLEAEMDTCYFEVIHLFHEKVWPQVPHIMSNWSAYRSMPDWDQTFVRAGFEKVEKSVEAYEPLNAVYRVYRKIG